MAHTQLRLLFHHRSLAITVLCLFLFLFILYYYFFLFHIQPLRMMLFNFGSENSYCTIFLYYYASLRKMLSARRTRCVALRPSEAAAARHRIEIRKVVRISRKKNRQCRIIKPSPRAEPHSLSFHEREALFARDRGQRFYGGLPRMVSLVVVVMV